MVELAQEIDLALKAFSVNWLTDLKLKSLYGHESIHAQLRSFVNVAHSSAADELFNAESSVKNSTNQWVFIRQFSGRCLIERLIFSLHACHGMVSQHCLRGNALNK